MHLHFERNTNAKCDCAILSLSWMGKVPDEFPEDEGWKLNRTNYYQEGWLATGNVRGIVGVTFTTSHCKKNFDLPLRTNYNLRGHRSEVTLVKWNEPYQKLASCDSSGIIFVWIKYEGRWSIELINDRNTPVTYFSWSHDGRMALICYQDGFVLVGSVAGQRYWSSMLNLESTIMCGIWTPDDQQVYFGTSSGQIIVMDVHGAMVSQVQLGEDMGITGMSWSCEKFKMEENEESEGNASQNYSADNRAFIMAVSFKNGVIYLMKNYDDVSPIRIETDLQGVCMEWSNSGELLAVAGSILLHGEKPEYTNILKFYTETGVLLSTVEVAYSQSPVTALTWGHNDKRLFVATGCQIHIAWVSRKIASLQFLCRLQIHRMLRNETQITPLPLPCRIKGLICSLFAQTIRCGVPDPSQLREFVSRPPTGSVRLHCTMIRHDEESHLSPGSCYTLYLEYLGGLVPLLKGKRTSKIRPEFVIFDPQVDDKPLLLEVTGCETTSSSGKPVPPPYTNGNLTDSSDSECEDSCASPRMQRRKYNRRKARAAAAAAAAASAAAAAASEGGGESGELAYIDTLPECDRLVEVTSNIWGTKFKIHGLAASLPANLGQVTYKTSLLHLQPRQMTLVITELRDDVLPGPDPSFNPNFFSEDEEEGLLSDVETATASLLNDVFGGHPSSPLPGAKRRLSRQRMANGRNDYLSNLGLSNGYDDSEEYPYVDMSVNPEVLYLREALRGSGGCGGGTTGSHHNNNHHHHNSSHHHHHHHGGGGTHGTPHHRGAGGALPRHTGGGLCCEGVPQSPKRNVAPSEVSEVQLVGGEFSAAELVAAAGGVQRVKLGLVARAVIERGTPKEPPAVNPSRGNPRPWTAGTETTPQPTQPITTPTAAVGCEVSYQLTPSIVDHLVRSVSVGFLDLVDVQSAAVAVAQDLRVPATKEMPKRLVLVNRGREKTRPRLKACGKSRSLDSSDFASHGHRGEEDPLEGASALPPAPHATGVTNGANGSNGASRGGAESSDVKGRAPSSSGGVPKRSLVVPPPTPHHHPAQHQQAPSLPPSPSPSHRSCLHMPRSSPSSPAMRKKGSKSQSSSPIRNLLNSPLLSRRHRKNKMVESSDEEITLSGDEIINGKNFKDLESFQKAQLRQKMRKGKHRAESAGAATAYDVGPHSPRRREFVMHNKAPMWNENSQVYQLDFGGRVTQESAKNFQIEFRGKQVMQFGRIDGNAYTLDFQYPFSALQAFAVALANVTQRLK